jgi:hypothetical protein
MLNNSLQYALILLSSLCLHKLSPDNGSQCCRFLSFWVHVLTGLQISHNSLNSAGVLFVSIAAKKFTGRVNSLPFVVFREHSRDPSCAHLPIIQPFCQNPINARSGNLGNRNSEIIEFNAPILTYDSLNLRDCLVRK